MFSACLRLSPSTRKLPFLVFLTVFGLALVDITFSIRKGENLARHTSSKDSVTMNLGKSATSFTESDSERFRLVLLFEHAIYAVYFSLALRSSTHHRVQLMLAINQGVNPFALAETGDTRPYTRVVGRLPSRRQFQVISVGEIPILNITDPQSPPSSN